MDSVPTFVPRNKAAAAAHGTNVGAGQRAGVGTVVPAVAAAAGNGQRSASSSGSGSSPLGTSTSGKSRPETLCRNIIVHGYCKFAGKTCRYRHDHEPGEGVGSVTAVERIKTPEISSLKVDSPAFTPGASTSKKPVEAGRAFAIPEFVPRSARPVETKERDHSAEKYDGTDDTDLAYEGDDSFDESMAGLALDGSDLNPYPLSMDSGTMINGGGYYLTDPQYIRQPLQYHLLQSPLPHLSLDRLLPSQRTSHAFFMPPDLHENLFRRSEALVQVSPADAALPEQVGGFEALHLVRSAAREPPLGSKTDEGRPRKTFGYTSSLYRAKSSSDGMTYALYRLEGFRLTMEAAIHTIDQWQRVRHPNVVSLHEAFTSRGFGDSSILFVYDFHPSSESLHDRHFVARTPKWSHGSAKPSNGLEAISDRMMWSYIVQIANGIRAIHQAGLAVRTLAPNKILVTGEHRLRINGVGVLDVITYEPEGRNHDSVMRIQHYRQEDLFQFGRLIIALGTQTPGLVQNLSKSVEQLARRYSPDLKNLVLYLLSKPTATKSIDEILSMLTSKVVTELDSTFTTHDHMDRALEKEVENGRLVRLLCKFGFINERPEFDHDPRWSETGDRYLIKLFRDYVFHQVDESGKPVVNLGHILTCLNKLDAGIDERIMMISRDEQSCLVVSYKDIKSCVDSAFRDLARSPAVKLM